MVQCLVCRLKRKKKLLTYAFACIYFVFFVNSASFCVSGEIVSLEPGKLNSLVVSYILNSPEVGERFECVAFDKNRIPVSMGMTKVTGASDVQVILGMTENMIGKKISVECSEK